MIPTILIPYQQIGNPTDKYINENNKNNNEKIFHDTNT